MKIENILKTRKGPRKPLAKRTPKEMDFIRRLRIAAYAPPSVALKMYDEIFNEAYGRIRS